MKFGQALSVLEAALPDEVAAPYREQLTRLQDSAPPMPTQTVRDQLDQGPRRRLGRPAGVARRRPDRGRVDRAGAQGTLGRRPRGRGQGAVPRSRRGADVRPPPARSRRQEPGAGAARHRHQGDHRGGAGPGPRRARLRARGRGPASLRRGLPRRPGRRHPRCRRRRQPHPGHRVAGEPVLAGPGDPRGHPGAARPLRPAVRPVPVLRAGAHGDAARRPAPRQLPDPSGRRRRPRTPGGARLRRGRTPGEPRPSRGDGPAHPDRRGRGPGRPGGRSPRRGVHQGPGPDRPRPAPRLPRAVRRADQGGAASGSPGSGCAGSSSASTTRGSPRTRSR